MAGLVSSMADIPLSKVLSRDYLAAEDDLRRLASNLDSRRPATDRGGWHWYPEREGRPQPSGDRIRHLLVDTAITMYDTDADWLELSLDIAWGSPPHLIVNAAVEVACWCPQDHNMHPVREARWDVTNGDELVEAFAAATAMLSGVLSTGPYEPRSWRTRAGLPDAPP